jgi:hypothetical protein
MDVVEKNGLVYAANEGFGLRIIDFGPEYAVTQPVDVDILPGSDSNPINPSSGGCLPVAILGAVDFDVADVDVNTLSFGPGEAIRAHDNAVHLEDVNSDDLPDLVTHFWVEETGIAFGTMMACLEGETFGGMPFSGCDAVRTVPEMDGDGILDVQEEVFGTNPLIRDTDADGFDDREEIYEMGTDPLDPLDPMPDPVPEPAGWLMLVAGIGMLGMLARRRQ